MAKRKTTKRKTSTKKIDKEYPTCKMPVNKTWMCHANEGKGFFGRALFAIFGLIALSQAGLLDGISTWILVFVGIGFALMRL